MPSSLEVTPLHASDHALHLFVTHNDKSWLSSLIYGRNNDAVRNNFLNHFGSMDTSTFPWLITGDFNVI